MNTLTEKIITRIAGIIDDVMIFYFIFINEGDKPCGRIQSWARINRSGNQYESIIKAKKYFYNEDV